MAIRQWMPVAGEMFLAMNKYKNIVLKILISQDLPTIFEMALICYDFTHLFVQELVSIL